MRLLLLNQTFHPDVMATSQYLSEVAVELVRQGHQVSVVTGNRAYDDPGRRFAARESWKGIEIYRVGSTAFGKTAKWRRAADFASFIMACVWRLLLLPRHDVVVALTTPPLISFIGACLASARGSRFVYWVMDMNPDEAIAAGWLRQGSPAARVLEWMSRFSFRHAHRIIALDRFMADRIVAKGIPREKVVVLPPWSHDDEVFFDGAGREKFRRAHGLEDKFVVMYSGNHSPVHPLDTLLQAAKRMRDTQEVVFCFVGGGSEWRKIKEMQGPRDQGPRDQGISEKKAESGKLKAEIGLSTISHNLSTPQSTLNPQPPTSSSPQLSAFSFQRSPDLSTNLKCLPYQPLDQLSGSLSAADLHVVVMGDAMLGLVHPCKIYNILSVGAPVLCIGPHESHLSDLLHNLNGQYLHRSVAHGDVDGVLAAIETIRSAPPERRQPGVPKANRRKTLLPRFIEALTTSGRDDLPRRP